MFHAFQAVSHNLVVNGDCHKQIYEKQYIGEILHITN